jgi:hypothetical protein
LQKRAWQHLFQPPVLCYTGFSDQVPNLKLKVFYWRIKMERKPLPVGVDNYKKLIEKGYYHVDKTLFIKELLDKKSEVTLIPRPRRFGKTLNMSMLKYFFEITDEDRTHLFVNKQVWLHESCRKEFGQYPVIFLSFKTIKKSTFEKAYNKIETIVAEEYKNHRYLLDEKTLTTEDKDIFTKILSRTAIEADVENSLHFLSDLLCKHHGKPAIILLDEYDTPINSAYVEGYYKLMVDFLRNMLHAVCKGNNSLAFGVLTGIMRTAKEGIFSGLNNLDVCSLLHDFYADKFGFTQAEVDLMLTEYGLTEKHDEIREWYNGYLIGEDNPVQAYNPWSIVSCVKNNGKIKPYWKNSSDNAIIKKLLVTAARSVQEQMGDLLFGGIIKQQVDEGMVFPDMNATQKAVWSLFLFSGYLTSVGYEGSPGKEIQHLKIPNKELMIMFPQMIQDALEQAFTTNKIEDLLNSITAGDAELFQKYLCEFIQDSMSVYDFDKRDPELSYHLFVLGLLAIMKDFYDIKSNRESGMGRYDIMLKPYDTNKLGIIIEIKRKHKNDSSLEAAADKAIAQIAEKKYVMELKTSGIKKSIGYGIAFLGKDCVVRSVEICSKL